MCKFDKLFKKLVSRGVPPVVIRILKNKQLLSNSATTDQIHLELQMGLNRALYSLPHCSLSILMRSLVSSDILELGVMLVAGGMELYAMLTT